MARIIYEKVGQKRLFWKEISLPKKRYGLGIVKQREGQVVIGYFLKPPEKGGWGKDNFIMKYIKLPKDTKGASARLAVGQRIISRAK